MARPHGNIYGMCTFPYGCSVSIKNSKKSKEPSDGKVIDSQKEFLAVSPQYVLSEETMEKEEKSTTGI